MVANYINFVSSLIYGDVGAVELGLPAGGASNHFNWTLDWLPATSTVPGTEFLNHHVTVMLGRYEIWRSVNNLPPVRPWDGTDVFPHLITPAVNPAPVAALFAPAFPGNYTENQLSIDVREYYNRLRNVTSGTITTELDDEIKAPFSYRYWAFMKWASDLRKRWLGQQVFPVGIVYDRDGTILSEKEFMDMFNSVHHVWHPFSGPPAAWTDATPGYKTSVGQRRRKKAGNRVQVGAEFFRFHRDHLLVMDRWLARTGQDQVQSINTCAHDATGTSTFAAPATLDVVGQGNFGRGRGLGYPVVNYTSRAVNFAPTHNSIWDDTLPGFNLGAFSSLGQMGQLFAPDSSDPAFAFDSVPGVPPGEESYHGFGHILNGDLRTAYVNNFSPRFYAWHGFIDTIWERRQPRFTTFVPVKEDGSPFVNPQALTIIRDPSAGPDSVESSNAIAGIDLANGNGTLSCRINVRADPFGRPLQLALRCDVLREAGGSAPVITLTRNLTISTGAPANPNERQQGLDFIEPFIFDGTPGTVDTVGTGKGPFTSDNTPAGGTLGVGFLNSLVRVTGTLTCNVLPNGSAGLDGFDHEERIDIPLIQEKSAPAITAYLDRSTFSIGQVQAVVNVATGESHFDDAFYIAIQDRTARPAPIPWPPDVEPQLYGLLAPPVPAAGLFYPDPALTHVPSVELRDAVTDAALTGDVAVVVTAADPEDPTLHPSVPQRITYRCRVVFTGTGAFSALTMANQERLLKLVITARDRSGNQVTDDSSRVRLQFNENPYMLDGPVSWLSIDTRVFQVRQGQSRFGVTMGTDPNAFIDQVIVALRLGNGTAGGESFDGLPQDQAGSALEYSTTVGGNNVYNFALAKVHLQSTGGATGVRASFRLFRWGVANVSFDNGLAYRSAASGVALLGQTSNGELASIPFFSAPRGGADMNTQLDDRNVDDFPSGDVSRVFGAYLDINQSAVQLPQSFIGDGGFGGVPPAQMRSIRDLLISHHQCMVVEVFYPPDPTIPGANPGTSDNLSQRNLMILQTANPGSEATRMIQHSFNIDLSRQRRQGRLTHDGGEQPLTRMAGTPSERDDDDQAERPIPLPARPARSTTFGHGGGSNDHGSDHGQLLWLAQFPEVVEELRARGHAQEEEMSRWQFDLDQWKSNDGLDELVFFWNNLPQDSQVEVYLPGASVEEIINYRNLRHAPGTVQIVDSRTLSLRVAGPTYLPIPPFWGDNLAGLVTVTLPAGIKERQKFFINVVQMRSDSRRVLGGFQLNIQVSKANQLFEPEKRLLEIFHQRLSLTPSTSRWRPILERQVEFIRERARGFVEQLNDPDVKWEDPTEYQHGQNVRFVLERIQILDDHDPFIKGAGEFRFKARMYSRDNNGLLRETRFPEKGRYSISDKAGRNIIHLDLPLFEGFVEDHLAVEITGIEMDTFDRDDEFCPYRRIFMGTPESWLGSFGPGDEKIEPEDLGDWRLWYRIERA